jgi:hypothetical protein
MPLKPVSVYLSSRFFVIKDSRFENEKAFAVMWTLAVHASQMDMARR